jgi:cytochrome P450
MQAISLRVILHAVLGLDGDRARVMERLVLRVIDALSPSLMFVKALQRSFGGFGPFAQLVRAQDAVLAYLEPLITARRSDGKTREDILSLILEARYDDGSAMTNRQVIETMMTLIVAGHETTALSLVWALWLLHRHPPVLARLMTELRTVDANDPDGVTRLPYLEAVCNETMRIKPIVPSLVRVLKEPLLLDGRALPPRTCTSAPSCMPSRTHFGPSGSSSAASRRGSSCRSAAGTGAASAPPSRCSR